LSEFLRLYVESLAITLKKKCLIIHVYQTLFWILQGNRWNGIVYNYIEIYNSENISPQTSDIWMSIWINKMLWMIPYFMLIYRVDLTICFPTIGIIDLEVMYFRMSDSNVCSSWDSIGRTNIFFLLRIIPPKSHCPLTSHLQWYCRRLNFASSISTIIPSPPIWLFDC